MPYHSRGSNKIPAIWALELSFSPCSCQVSSYSKLSLPPTLPSYPVVLQPSLIATTVSVSHPWSPVVEMKKPFNDLTELDTSGFKIGGLDTGATKTIFQVLLPSALERHWGQLCIAERRRTEPGSGRVQMGGSGNLWWGSQESRGRPRMGLYQPHSVHLPHHAGTRCQVCHDRKVKLREGRAQSDMNISTTWFNSIQTLHQIDTVPINCFIILQIFKCRIFRNGSHSLLRPLGFRLEEKFSLCPSS